MPEASPTHLMPATCGLTFSFSVTIGIPLSNLLAEAVIPSFPT
ncbi:hypothetical protein TA3x_004696 [Tundrisphaera sp. TA3]